MSEATTRARLKTILEAVTGIGTVHDYERWAIDPVVFLERFKATISTIDYIRGWTITCQSFTQEYLDYAGDEGGTRQYLVLRNYTYKIRMYYGLDDSAASEKSAIALAEDVIEALDTADSLHDEDNYFGQTPPASLDAFVAVNFGGFLCHYAEITQTLREVVVV